MAKRSRSNLIHAFKLLIITLFSCGLLLSLLFNVLWTSRPPANQFEYETPADIEKQLPQSDTTRPHPRWKDVHDLIIVPGHAVLVPNADITHHSVLDPSQWVLQQQQIEAQQHIIFVSHIRRAVAMAAANRQAMLVFSGGETRESAGPLGEAVAYLHVAETCGWFAEETKCGIQGWSRLLEHGESDGSDQTNNAAAALREVRSRTVLEEYARDSFDNLLFSIARFYEVTNKWPRTVTVVGFGFKKNRFVSLHAPAIRFPSNRLFYVDGGKGDVIMESQDQVPRKLKDLEESEYRNAVALFRMDPYACRGVLRSKKISRNPFSRTAPYWMTARPIRSLLAWCGPETYRGPLPWTAADDIAIER